MTPYEIIKCNGNFYIPALTLDFEQICWIEIKKSGNAVTKCVLNAKKTNNLLFLFYFTKIT